MIKRNIRSTPVTKIDISAHLGSIKVGASSAEETLKRVLEQGELYGSRKCSPKLQSHKINVEIISRKVHSPKYTERSELKKIRHGFCRSEKRCYLNMTGFMVSVEITF